MRSSRLAFARTGVLTSTLVALTLSACDTDTEANEETAPAVVTGIHVTTVVEPFGTGEVLGVPTYPPGSALSPAPNPYIGGVECPLSNPACGQPEQTIYFPGVPARHEVRIYEATGGGDGSDAPSPADLAGLLADGQVTWAGTGTSVTENTGALLWPLQSASTALRSGLFRAVLVDPDGHATAWADLYVVLRADYPTWVDPTGWLPDDWRP